MPDQDTLHPAAIDLLQRLEALCHDKVGAELINWHLGHRDNYQEEYVIRWRRARRVDLLEGNVDYGTHVALIDLKWLPGLVQDMLIWGHYDMDDTTSMLDYRKRRGF